MQWYHIDLKETTAKVVSTTSLNIAYEWFNYVLPLNRRVSVFFDVEARVGTPIG